MLRAVPKDQEQAAIQNQCQNRSVEQCAFAGLEISQRKKGRRGRRADWYAGSCFLLPVLGSHGPLPQQREEGISNELPPRRSSFDVIEDRQHFFREAFAKTRGMETK
jgi:hypothetical protein